MQWQVLIGALCLLVVWGAPAGTASLPTNHLEIGVSVEEVLSNSTAQLANATIIENVTQTDDSMLQDIEGEGSILENSSIEDLDGQELVDLTTDSAAVMVNFSSHAVKVPGLSDGPVGEFNMYEPDLSANESASENETEAGGNPVEGNQASRTSHSITGIGTSSRNEPPSGPGFYESVRPTGPKNDRGDNFIKPVQESRDSLQPKGESVHKKDDFTFVVIAMGIAGLAAIGAASQGSSPAIFGRSLLRFFWGGIALFAHIGRKKALKHPNRQQLYDVVSINPGVCEGDLYQIAGLGRSSVRYHLSVLEQNGYIKSYKVGKKRHFYLQTCSKKGKEHATLMHGAQRRVAQTVLKEPGINQKKVCEKLRISPSRAHERLAGLIQAGLITKRAVGNTVRYYPTERLENFTDDLSVMMAQPA